MAAVVVRGPSENKPRVTRCRGREEQYPEHLACDLRRSRVCRVAPAMVRAFADLSADPLLPARAGKGNSMTAWICFRCLVRGLQSMIRNGAWFRETGGAGGRKRPDGALGAWQPVAQVDFCVSDRLMISRRCRRHARRIVPCTRFAVARAACLARSACAFARCRRPAALLDPCLPSGAGSAKCDRGCRPAV
jgi:hypothetical protein